MLRDRSLRLAAVVAASFALAACSETARITPTSRATPVGVPSVPATVNPAPTTAAPPSGSAPATGGTGSATPSATKGAGGNEVKATMANKFEPATLTVKAGTKVTWTAEGFHTANSGEPPTVDTKGPIQAAMGFKTYSVTFKEKGTFKYFCQPHAPGMAGEIVVT